MAKFFSLAALVVAGAMLADVLIHPQGTQAASQGFSSIEKPALNAVLGTPS
jgi:hypothetical protein